jgi:hypothetical protein
MSRRLSYLIELHYPGFFDACDHEKSYAKRHLAWIPAKATILGEIVVRLKLKDLQRITRVQECTDLS